MQFRLPKKYNLLRELPKWYIGNTLQTFFGAIIFFYVDFARMAVWAKLFGS